MMKKECRVVIYKEGLLGSLFFGEAKADPDKMSQFLSSYTREGWEEKPCRWSDAVPPCSGRGKRICLCLNGPSDGACAWFNRLSQALPGIRAQGWRI